MLQSLLYHLHHVIVYRAHQRVIANKHRCLMQAKRLKHYLWVIGINVHCSSVGCTDLNYKSKVWTLVFQILECNTNWWREDLHCASHSSAQYLIGTGASMLSILLRDSIRSSSAQKATCTIALCRRVGSQLAGQPVRQASGQAGRLAGSSSLCYLKARWGASLRIL